MQPKQQRIMALCQARQIDVEQRQGGSLRFRGERVDVTVAGWDSVTEHDLRPMDVVIPAKRFKREVLQQQY